MEQKKNIDLTTFKLDDFFSTQEDRDEDKKEKVEIIDLSLIDDFPEHPFKVQENEDLSKLKESIKDNGVLEPIIVRKKENNRYEIIAGHRRKFASELLGNNFIPCIVRDMTKEGAIIVLSCIIFSLFASSPPVVDSSAAAVTQVWKYIGELIFNMLVLVGTIKISDRIVREMMGL